VTHGRLETTRELSTTQELSRGNAERFPKPIPATQLPSLGAPSRQNVSLDSIGIGSEWKLRPLRVILPLRYDR